jgi:hypothetical protein
MASTDSTSSEDRDVRAAVIDTLCGHWRSQIIRSLAMFDVADHLAAGALPAAEIAARQHSDVDRTRRLMRAAAAIGLLESNVDGTFASTPELATLRRDAPQSLRPVVMGLTSPWHTTSFRYLPDAVQHGIEPTAAALGTDLFTYLGDHPDEAREFSELMAALTPIWAGDAADVIDTTGVRRVVDVGGSTGSLLRMLQQRNPDLRGVIFDRPDVVADVALSVQRGEFASRTEVVAGDFFSSVPAGDLLLLKMILHDWDDDHCVTILQRCREAVASGGRVVIVEWIVGETAAPGFAALMDMNMLVSCQDGRERTLGEFDALLRAAGLRRETLHTNASGHGVIEARAE